MSWRLLRSVPHVQNDNFLSRFIDRVEDQEWISNHGQDADIGFVCRMSGEWKLLKEFRKACDTLHDRRSPRSIAFEYVGKNAFDFGERGLGPANLHAL
jgi:hypothetical protein